MEKGSWQGREGMLGVAMLNSSKRVVGYTEAGVRIHSFSGVLAMEMCYSHRGG